MAFAAGLLGGVPMCELEDEEDEADEVQGPMAPAKSSAPPPASGSLSGSEDDEDGDEDDEDDDEEDSGDRKTPREKARDPKWVQVCASTTRTAHNEAMFNEFQSCGSLRNGTPRAIPGTVKSVKSIGKVRNFRCAFWNSAECPARWREEERDGDTFVLMRASAPEMQHNAHEPNQKVLACARAPAARARARTT